MCNTYEYPRQYKGSGRRRFLRLTSAAAVAGFAQISFLSGVARADALTRAQRNRMSPQEIIDDMKQGNARFQKGERKPRNYLREQRASAAGQYPAAALLSSPTQRVEEHVGHCRRIDLCGMCWI